MNKEDNLTTKVISFLILLPRLNRYVLIQQNVFVHANQFPLILV